jgi:hypothetical protein
MFHGHCGLIRQVLSWDVVIASDYCLLRTRVLTLITILKTILVNWVQIPDDDYSKEDHCTALTFANANLSKPSNQQRQASG